VLFQNGKNEKHNIEEKFLAYLMAALVTPRLQVSSHCAGPSMDAGSAQEFCMGAGSQPDRGPAQHLKTLLNGSR